MRCLWLALALSLSASVAEAQVQQGSFKLSIDTDVLNFAAETREDTESDVSETTTTFSVGPGGSLLLTGQPGWVSFAFGYVAHPHVIPQLRLSFANASGSSEFEFDGETDDTDLPSITVLMLRPELEIPFNPDSSVVAFGLLGFDYRHIGTSEEDEDGIETNQSFNGYGPALGAGLHIFAGDGIASFDLRAQFSYLVFSQSAEVDGEDVEGLDDIDRSAKIFSINAGLSLWP